MWECEKTKLTAEKCKFGILDRIIYVYMLLGSNLILFFLEQKNKWKASPCVTMDSEKC